MAALIAILDGRPQTTRRLVRSERPGRRARRGAPGSPKQRTVRGVRALLGALAAAGGAVGCSGDTTGPAPITSAVQAYWVLQLNYHAVNLSLTPPTDTVQLTATPVNALGTPLAGAGAVTYTAADSSVTVSPTGLVTAHYRTVGTNVVASLQDQGVLLEDTVFLQVTPTPLSPPLATFSLQPAPNDSAKRDLDFQQFPWPVTATVGVGDTVCNGNGCKLIVDYRSSNPSVASIDRRSGVVNPLDVGATVFSVTTLAYGQVWRDSVRFRVGYPLNPIIYAYPAVVNGKNVLAFKPAQIVGVGATVDFSPEPNGGYNPGLDSIDVVFDDSTAVQPGQFCLAPGFCAPPAGGGNIPPFGWDTTKFNAFANGSDPNLFDFYNTFIQARSFPTAGTYPYHSRIYNTNGIIIVRPDAP